MEAPLRISEGARPKSAHLSSKEEILTTGLKQLDKLVQLATGQFVVFQGLSTPISLAELLCVRAQLDHPIGLNSNAIFIDGGNSFDAYTTSNYASEYGIEPTLALSRIHIIRAFTYFQLASLLTEELLSVFTRYSSRFVIISDITELFQDPEIKDKQEAYRSFQRVVRSLSAVAEITGSLVITTNFHQNIRPFDTALMRAAHATIFTEGQGTLTQFALMRHRSLPLQRTAPREDRGDQLIKDLVQGREWGESSYPGGSS